MDIVKQAKVTYWFAAVASVFFVFLTMYLWSIQDDAYGWFGGFAILSGAGSQFLFVMTNREIKRQEERNQRLKKLGRD